MKPAARIVPVAIALWACSPEQSNTQNEVVQETIEAPIPAIKGNDVHNRLATAQLGLRNLYLSRILRGLGEDCWVVDRSMYQGYAAKLGASLWSAHCEIGTDWMVSVNKDGSGSILRCGELSALDTAMRKRSKSKIEGLSCWERFKD